MIYVIEGPDCSGKSTLYAALQRHVTAKFVYIPKLPVYPLEVMQRELDMWHALYDPRQVYVCDRHVITSNRVYAAYYKRPQLPTSWLESCIRIVYLKLSAEELVRRHCIRGETVQDPQRYNEVLDLYEQMLTDFQHIIHTDIPTTARWINGK